MKLSDQELAECYKNIVSYPYKELHEEVNKIHDHIEELKRENSYNEYGICVLEDELSYKKHEIETLKKDLEYTHSEFNKASEAQLKEIKRLQQKLNTNISKLDVFNDICKNFVAISALIPLSTEIMGWILIQEFGGFKLGFYGIFLGLPATLAVSIYLALKR